MKKRPGQRGFTLIELLVTMTVLAVLLTVGIPNLQQFIQNSRLASQASQIAGDLNFARAEAVKRGGRVTICPSVNGATCAGNTTWETGWIVFNDANVIGAVDGADTVLRATAALGGGSTMRTNNRSFIVFSAQGYSVGSNDTFRVCQGADVVSARSVIVSNQGRVTSAQGTASCP